MVMDRTKNPWGLCPLKQTLHIGKWNQKSGRGHCLIEWLWQGLGLAFMWNGQMSCSSRTRKTLTMLYRYLGGNIATSDHCNCSTARMTNDRAQGHKVYILNYAAWVDRMAKGLDQETYMCRSKRNCWYLTPITPLPEKGEDERLDKHRSEQ